MNEEEKKERKSEISNGVLYTLLALIIICLVGVFVGRLQQLQKKAIQEDRAETLLTITEKVSTIVNTGRSPMWPYADIIAERISGGDFQDVQELTDYLAYAAEMLDYAGTSILLVDDRGEFLCSDGDFGVDEGLSEALLTAAAGEHSTAVAYLKHIGTEAPYMLLINPFEEDVTVLGRRLKYTVLCVDTAEFGSLMSGNQESDSYETVIAMEDGRAIYESENIGLYLSAEDIFTDIRSMKFIGDTDAETFIANAMNGIRSVARIQGENGTEFLLACGERIDKDWVCLNSVRTDRVSSGMGEFMNTTTQYMITFMIIFTIVLFCLFFLVLRSRREKAEHEKELLTVESYRQIAEKERAASEAKTEFLSNMSHDIRTPINGIMGMTAIARKSVDDPEKVSDCLEKIDDASGHLLSLINDVLDMSRIERGKTQLAHSPMSVQTVAENCATIIGGQMEGRDLTLETDIAVEHPRVIGDELHLRQILINILGNCVKFTPDGGRISLSLKELPKDESSALYRFVIADTGIGMKEDFLSRIFDPFAQEESGARTNYKGTGLGMSITKQFVDLMGGSIDVQSEYGKGSTFTVEIPMEIDAAAAAAEEAVELAPADLNGMRILLVEDNELNQEIACELLEDEGAIVKVACNGQEAVEEFVNTPPGTYDVILMDVMMPVLNGLEATRTIRAARRKDAKTIPILAMTANAFEEDRQKVLAAGMNAHLSKPIDIDAVRRAVAEFVAKNTNS